MKIAVVRGTFLNQFEMQNYLPLAKRHELTAFSSLRPIHEEIGFPVVRLPSPMDLLSLTPIFKCIGVKRCARGVLNRVFIDAHYLFGLEKVLRGFDIAHCAETYYHFTQQALRAKRKGFVKKVVSTVWENTPFANEGIWGRRSFKRKAREEVSHFIAVTKMARDVLIAEGCREEKITVIPMGVNLDKFKMQNSKIKITKFASPSSFGAKKSKSLTILFVGRLEEEKGVKELLKVYQQITKNKKQIADKKGQAFITLKIVGSGSLEGWIKKWIKRNELKRQVVVEKLDYQEMPAVYQDADIFVLPSKKTKTWQEQFGMVLVEAMASSLPIVATRSGAIPEVMGKCGMLVEEKDVIGLYKALRVLIKDESLRVKLGKMGRRRAEKYFDSQKVARKIEKVYDNLSRCFN